jgi:hypothetical protein
MALTKKSLLDLGFSKIKNGVLIQKLNKTDFIFVSKSNDIVFLVRFDPTINMRYSIVLVRLRNTSFKEMKEYVTRVKLIYGRNNKKSR